MTVAQLIDKLLQLPPDDEVCMEDDYYSDEHKEIEGIKKDLKFDGYYYDDEGNCYDKYKDVWVLF